MGSGIQTYISTVFTDQFGNGSDIPHLRHTQYGAHPANNKGSESRNANGKLRRIPPDPPVVPSAETEDESLLEDNGNPDDNPVAHQSEEIGKDLREIAAANERADGIDNYGNGIPDDAWYCLGVATEDLEVDAGGVSGRDGIGDQA